MADFRLLHVTDTHLGVDQTFQGAPEGWRRADDHLDALRAALAPALRGEVDAVIHSGDVFDRSHAPIDAIVAAAELFAAVARLVPMVLMPGNHDRFGLRLHFRHGIPGVEICDEANQLRLGPLRVAFVPYLKDAADWAAAARQAVGGGVDALVAHQAFHGSRVPGFTFWEGRHPDTIGARHLPPGVRHILCGHIHHRQELRLGEALVVHPGSTERTAWVERDGAKGYTAWQWGGTPRWRHIDVPTRPMVLVADPVDLEEVQPGTLVHLESAIANDEIADAVVARGGYLTAWRKRAARQQRLFSGRRGEGSRGEALKGGE